MITLQKSHRVLVFSSGNNLLVIYNINSTTYIPKKTNSEVTLIEHFYTSLVYLQKDDYYIGYGAEFAEEEIMKIKSKNRYWTGILPWALLAVFVLSPLFVFG